MNIAKLGRMVRTVCVIGAGPAGIVTAKTFLHDVPKGSFEVTVFEASSRIGGLWPLDKEESHGMVNPEMSTNVSRHTVSFSDLAWPENEADDSSTTRPQYVKAWQVGTYLQRYIETYRLAGVVRTGCRVVRTERRDGDVPEGKRWSVQIQNLNEATSTTETYEFDHLIVASGFFGKPYTPPVFQRAINNTHIPVLHSTQFRRVDDLLKVTDNTSQSKGGKIVVVGGNMSGVEVAASIAMQLSSSANSPGNPEIKNAEHYTVHHILQRPLWIVPLFLPTAPMVEGDGTDKVPNQASPFLPLDLVAFTLTGRPPGPLENTSGHIAPTAANSSNDRFEMLFGNDQSDLLLASDTATVSPLTLRGSIRSEAPWLAISDTYPSFTRSGLIVPSLGHAVAFSSEDATMTVLSNTETPISDVAAIILATGFEPIASLSFLPESVLKTLNYDPQCSPFPLALDAHSTTHHLLPDLGFTGFYRSPYWGVMESQARYLASLFLEIPSTVNALHEDNGVQKILGLRKVWKETPGQFAQFPMGDYAYLMESFRTILNNERIGEERSGAVLPARYLPGSPSEGQKEESKVALAAVSKLIDAANNECKFVARAIFTALQGGWKLSRKMISSIAIYPSGQFEGTARFLPRYPTAEGYDLEYLYIEEGDFETETGLKFKANRRYAYRYSSNTDTLSVWFIKGDNKTVDYLFHEFEILSPQKSSTAQKDASTTACPRVSSTGTEHEKKNDTNKLEIENLDLGKNSSGTSDINSVPNTISGTTASVSPRKQTGWRARAHHLCIDDTYDVEYEFVFRGIGVQSWVMKYDVRGPQKDYRIESWFVR